MVAVGFAIDRCAASFGNADFCFWLRVLKNSVFEAFRMGAASKGEVFFSASARWPGGFGLFGSCD